MLWNEASRTIRGWPQLEVQVPSEKLQYSFDWDQFPPSLLEDLEAYIQHLGNEDPFADDYLSPLRPATVANRRKQIRQIASAAVHSRMRDQRDHQAGRSGDGQECGAGAFGIFWDRAGQEKKESLYQYATLLRSIARHWAKASPSDLAYIEARCRAFAVKKHGMVEKNRALLMQFDDPANVDALLSLPGRLLRRVQEADKGGRDDVVLVATALAIELLINAPIRVENLTSLRWEGHFLRSRVGRGHVVHLAISGDEIKNSEPFEMELPKGCVDFLDLYLQTYRSQADAGPLPLALSGLRGRASEYRLLLALHLQADLAGDRHQDACPPLPPAGGEVPPGCPSRGRRDGPADLGP